MTRNHYKKLKKQGLKQIILCGGFSIELNSTTDVSNISELTVFTRFSLKKMGREEGSGWGTHVYLWQIHFDIGQKQYNIVKLNKIKLKKKKKKEKTH